MKSKVVGSKVVGWFVELSGIALGLYGYYLVYTQPGCGPKAIGVAVVAVLILVICFAALGQSKKSRLPMIIIIAILWLFMGVRIEAVTLSSIGLVLNWIGDYMLKLPSSKSSRQ